MPLTYTAARSSRITKPGAGRSPLKRRRGGSSAQRKAIDAEVQSDSEEDDLYSVPALSLAEELSLRDVAQAIRHVRSGMFSEVPERGAGMNSTRIAEVLHFRRTLPPIVTVGHVHALLDAPTTVEREISELMRGHTIRKLVVPGRSSEQARGSGRSRSAATEGLVLQEDWDRVVNESQLTKEVKNRFIQILHQYSTALTVPHSLFTLSEASSLIQAGFLTVTEQDASGSSSALGLGPGLIGTLTSLSRAGSSAASGSMAATGGAGAVHEAGGSAGGTRKAGGTGGEFTLTLPSIGPYLRLLGGARAHLVDLLTARSSTRRHHAPLDLLRQRWDGDLSPDKPGREKGTLPGRTRKWKSFYGLSFDWVLGECLGAGVMELFDTGTVGKGVRLA